MSDPSTTLERQMACGKSAEPIFRKAYERRQFFSPTKIPVGQQCAKPSLPDDGLRDSDEVNQVSLSMTRSERVSSARVPHEPFFYIHDTINGQQQAVKAEQQAEWVLASRRLQCLSFRRILAMENPLLP